MKVALIGGAGFIGHHLALSLARAGDEVHVIDGLDVNNREAFSALPRELARRELYLGFLRERIDLLHSAGVKLHVQDARNRVGLFDQLEKIEPEAMVHLAAVAHAGRANVDPHGTFEHSVCTLQHALDFARSSELERFVYLSSSMVYGDFQSKIVREDHPLDPIGIYGAMKLSCEKLVIGYNQVFGLPYTVVRPSALYGPRCVSRRIGQVFIENALEGRALRISGEGDERLDFTYIDDLVQGLTLALKKPAARNEVFNMTFGEGRSINDLVALFQERFPEVLVERVSRDLLMPRRGAMSVDKARDLLGYAPAYPLERGLPAYVEWYATSAPQLSRDIAAPARA